VTLDDVERARTTRALTWGRDDHYDVISAFIKSIRGSDADAGLHWLARMIVAGEDPRFIARRLVILASEDIGMADPTSLLIATAAAHAVEYVGLPEAQLNLAQAVVHLATAPKSNRTTVAIGNAMEDVRSKAAGPVPAHLRDAHYKSAERIGHGVGYEYPHDDARGWVEQDYLPEHLINARYYEPSEHGHEAEVGERRRRRDSRCVLTRRPPPLLALLDVALALLKLALCLAQAREYRSSSFSVEFYLRLAIAFSDEQDGVASDAPRPAPEGQANVGRDVAIVANPGWNSRRDLANAVELKHMLRETPNPLDVVGLVVGINHRE